MKCALFATLFCLTTCIAQASAPVKPKIDLEQLNQKITQQLKDAAALQAYIVQKYPYIINMMNPQPRAISTRLSN